MTPPKRIQRQRTRGWRKPEGAVIVTRPSKWGNPYHVRPIGLTEWVVVYKQDEIVGDKTRSRSEALRQCLDHYRDWAGLQMAIDPHWLDPLRGKDLACFCPLDQPCHADVLLELLANQQETRTHE